MKPGGEVFRAPMRSRSREAGPYEGAKFGVTHSLVGIGEPLSLVPGDLQQALAHTAEEHGAKSERMLKRFAELPDKTLVWTRTGEDCFRLGLVVGPWRYASSEPALETGICQVRPARWLPEEFDHLSAPRAVSFTFSRGGRNFQQIHDQEAESDSLDLLPENV